MDKSYAEQERDAVNLKLVEMKSAAERNVGKHYHRRRAELQERAENAVDLADVFVDKHDGRVKARRAKTEQNADSTAALAADTGYKQNAERGCGKAEPLLDTELFFEENAGKQSDENGSELVGKRSA